MRKIPFSARSLTAGSPAGVQHSPVSLAELRGLLLREGDIELTSKKEKEGRRGRESPCPSSDNPHTLKINNFIKID